MKARNALLLGCAAAAFAVVAGLLTKNVMVFRKICDYVYSFALVAALFFYVVALKPRREKRRITPLSIANPTDVSGKIQEFSKDIKNPAEEKNEDEYAVNEDKYAVIEEGETSEAAAKRRLEREKNLRYALLMLLIALPSILAVLIEYYWPLLKGN